jgi:biopolymer transport protein ExbD
MRFERKARIFRGTLDPSAAAGVLLLLLIFMLLGSLLYTPGVTIDLPEGGNWPGSDNPTVVVAMDASGQCFFENRAVREGELLSALTSRAQSTAQRSKNLTMVLWADKAAKTEVITRLFSLAQQAGIAEVRLAERPTTFGPRP